MREPCDQAARTRALSDLQTTFLVEAGAGTGKTRLLVERFVSCLLACGSVRRVVAITFTDKAAGELRLRVRARLRSLVERSEPRSERWCVLREALRDIDQAPISTIHAFAARLLRESPLEAGVDPAFKQLDALGGRLLFDRLWDEWLALVLQPEAEGHAAAGDGALATSREAVSTLLEAGMAVGVLYAAARRLFSDRFDLRAGDPPGGASGLAGARQSLLASADELVLALEEQTAFACAMCGDHEDKGFLAALDCGAQADRVRGARQGSIHRLVAAVASLPMVSPKAGVAKNWGGKEGKDAFQERCAAVRALRESILEEYGAALAEDILRTARTFGEWAARAQLQRGYLDFADLLGRLRDALRVHRGLRERWQQAFDYVLIDEFQDTDPLQAEIVLLLAEDGARAADWREVALKPGKLFVVGDPKQSIYRFRRADIGMYDDVKSLILRNGGEILSISQNFRTVPSVVTWVNQVFETVIGEDAAPRRQPEYVPLAAFRPEPESLAAAPGDAAPRVAVVCGPSVEPRAEELRRAEAEALARLLIQGIREQGWSVRERESDALQGSGEQWRPARWGDVAVLIRAAIDLSALEQALREAGIPYRIEAGKMFYRRREVRDTLLGLRAVADSADPLAVYGALHSTLFGFEDQRLYLFHVAGGRFDYFAEQPSGADAEICAALATLRAVHESAHGRPIDAILDDLLRRTWAFEAAAAWGDRAGQALANLRKLRQVARAFSTEEGVTLSTFVKWAQEQGTAAAEIESTVDDGGDEVRVLTVHGAKGLEFPIVVIADAWSRAGGGRDETRVLFDRRRGRCELSFSLARAASPDERAAGKLPAASSAYAELAEAEKAMEASERRRLLYVAATRAMDLLVIMLPGWPKNGSGSLLEPLRSWLPDPGGVDRQHVQDGAVILPAGEGAAPRAESGEPGDERGALALRETWRRRLQEVTSAAARPRAVVSPSSMEDLDLGEAEVPSGHERASLAVARRAALAAGATVHRIMEVVSLGVPDAVRVPAEIAEQMEALAVAAAEDLVAEGSTVQARAWVEQLVGMAQGCWLSVPVRHAAASPRMFREVPLCARIDDGSASEPLVLQGFCDLLYEAPDGWVVVDYKTDSVPDEARVRRRYELQAGGYALAVRQATGRRVLRAAFVMAAAGSSTRPAPYVEFAVTQELLRRARERAAQRANDLPQRLEMEGKYGGSLALGEA